KLTVPIICVVIGEGGSGGALAIGLGNRVLMMQYAIYSVISPEGCASILWKDSAKADLAAEALRLTAEEVLTHKVVDGVIPEPVGGAHRNPAKASDLLREHLLGHLRELSRLSPSQLAKQRFDKFMAMGAQEE
ncbi:MAG: acetyl-CoA carboxylase carboxyl transferase subunit alpha, partial [Magnetococcales bacterium]|nr:acetyl-CoA carboxylase carboxyl transferase subunit alpha [Magnetococcales bacterium]